MQCFRYVGPSEIRDRVRQAVGQPIRSQADLRGWISKNVAALSSGDLLYLTYTVDQHGTLSIADRSIEHVACAGGLSVVAAGELGIVLEQDEIVIEEVSNQSTGYCPSLESWVAVHAALCELDLQHPARFTTPCVFRWCDHCNDRVLVKDGWFYCEICSKVLPRVWNIPAE